MAPTTRRLLAGGITAVALSGCTARLGSPAEVPAEDPSDAWAALLGRAASSEGVDYDLVEEQREVLEAYLAWVGAHGELTETWKESQEDRRIAHLLNAYNAAVIYGVLEHRPIDSVRDVQVGLLRHPGAGFFVGLRFYVDGEWTSLHNLEHQRIVGRYQEPLVHVALNCASQSCPPVQWWRERGLQGRMRTAMRRFLASDRGLAPLPDGGWAANQLFRWYADDFTDWSEAATVCEWMADYTTGERHDWLVEQSEDCELQYQPFDWSLNARVDASPPGAAPSDEDDAEEPDGPDEQDSGDPDQ